MKAFFHLNNLTALLISLAGLASVPAQAETAPSASSATLESFNLDANLVLSSTASFKPFAWDEHRPLSNRLIARGSIQPEAIPVTAPVPTSPEMSQQARDLLPQPVLPAPLLTQTETTPPTAPASQEAVDQSEATAELARAAQNPIADLISVPFQNNWNFGVGPKDGTQYILNIQPVIPLPLGKDWLVVTRWIIPTVTQPELGPGLGSVSGLGDMNPSFFFVPKKTGDITVGFGPAFIFPTATSVLTGQGKWSVGPTGVVVYTKGQWVLGALANQVWSFAGESDRQSVSQFLLQPFLNYNMPGGWYIVSAPIITANWQADGGNQWTVPLGGGFGRLFRLANQPVNASLQAFGYVIKPEGGPDWQLRFSLQLLFPAR